MRVEGLGGHAADLEILEKQVLGAHEIDGGATFDFHLLVCGRPEIVAGGGGEGAMGRQLQKARVPDYAQVADDHLLAPGDPERGGVVLADVQRRQLAGHPLDPGHGVPYPQAGGKAIAPGGDEQRPSESRRRGPARPGAPLGRDGGPRRPRRRPVARSLKTSVLPRMARILAKSRLRAWTGDALSGLPVQLPEPRLDAIRERKTTRRQPARICLANPIPGAGRDDGWSWSGTAGRPPAN